MGEKLVVARAILALYHSNSSNSSTIITGQQEAPVEAEVLIVTQRMMGTEGTITSSSSSKGEAEAAMTVNVTLIVIVLVETDIKRATGTGSIGSDPTAEAAVTTMAVKRILAAAAVVVSENMRATRADSA